jgi:hypothetical protein
MFEQYRSRFDSYTPQQRAEIGKRAAVGLLGLILGLFIGWVIWPLDWRDASLENLAPELQARYLSAVADAYVATQDSGTALARLAEFPDPEQALTDAIRYYQATDMPNSAIRQVNLRALASATGAAEAVTQALQTDATLAPTSPAVREPAVGWLNWLLVLVAAMLLIVGGGWIGIQLMRNRMIATRSVRSQSTRVENGPEFDPPWESRASQSQRLSAWQIPDKDQGLDEEEDLEDEFTSTRSAKTVVIDATPVRPSPRTAPPPVVLEVELGLEKEQTRDFDDVGWENDGPYDEDSYDEEPVDEDSYDEDSYDEEPLDEQPYSAPLAAESLQDKEEHEEDEMWKDGQDDEDRSTDEMAFSTPVRPTPAYEETEPTRPAPTQQETEDTAPAEAATPAEPPPIPPIIPPGESAQDIARRTSRASKKRGAAGGDAAGPGSFQGKFNSFWRKDSEQQSEDFVAEYWAHYHSDIPDYDESFIITPTDDENTLFGACGMGINADLDPRAISNDEVRVLDVWFYDRDDSRSHNQLIVSNGIDVEALSEQFTSSGTITGNPLVAEPGTTFRLTGKNHYVICRIEEVTYRQRGEAPVPFESVKVHLSVHRQHK